MDLLKPAAAHFIKLAREKAAIEKRTQDRVEELGARLSADVASISEERAAAIRRITGRFSKK